MIPKPSRVLDDIVATYNLERDLLKIAQRAVGESELPFLRGTGFVGRPVADAQADVVRFRSRLDEMTITALWVEFERHLIQSLLSRIKISPSTVVQFDAQFLTYVENEIEFSRVGDLIDLYKVWVDPELLGRVKQIKDYRDWISHRNPNRRPPAIIDPVSARKILGSVMDEIG